LEEVANLRGVPVILTDTAGLGETDDPVERLGIQRTRDVLARADGLLIVLDATRPIEAAELDLLAETAARPRVVVRNKCDVAVEAPALPVGIETLSISALTGAGAAELEERLAALVTGGHILSDDAPILTNPRHKAAIERALAYLQQADAGLTASLPEDFATIDLRAGIEALGEITGESVTEDLLDSIFRNFCIGK